MIGNEVVQVDHNTKKSIKRWFFGGVKDRDITVKVHLREYEEFIGHIVYNIKSDVSTTVTWDVKLGEGARFELNEFNYNSYGHVSSSLNAELENKGELERYTLSDLPMSGGSDRFESNISLVGEGASVKELMYAFPKNKSSSTQISSVLLNKQGQVSEQLLLAYPENGCHLVQCPNLEAFNPDVKAGHGVVRGGCPVEDVAYLVSRGFSRKDAIFLIEEGRKMEIAGRFGISEYGDSPLDSIMKGWFDA